MPIDYWSGIVVVGATVVVVVVCVVSLSSVPAARNAMKVAEMKETAARNSIMPAALYLPHALTTSGTFPNRSVHETPAASAVPA